MKKIIAASALMCAVASEAMAEIKVGILHSLSGTMAISETTLKDTMLMLIDEQNAKGGLLGEEIVPVVVDPASDWPLFAEKARELLTVHDVDVIFGNWTSVSRKSVLPVIEELNGLLFYPGICLLDSTLCYNVLEELPPGNVLHYTIYISLRFDHFV